MYTLGPFMVTEIENLKAILEKNGADYDLFADEDLRDRLMEEFNQRATQAPRAAAGTLSLRYIFLELEVAEYAKVQHDMEKLGILPPSSGEWELSEEE